MKSLLAQFAPQQDSLQEDDDLRTQVWGILVTHYPRNDLVERRRDNRYPFPYLVHLTPVGPDGFTSAGDSVVVVGKYISERGFGFYHHAALPHRRVIASLETSQGNWVGFLMDLTWCRFVQGGWYESGGRFLQAVLSPMSK
jgi:hypothetical protein